MIDLDIPTASIDRLAEELSATEPQVKKALKTTISKMATWLRGRSTKGLSKELQIQQKIIRRRLKSFRLKSTSDGAEITIWYGLDPISLIYLQAKQNKQGVKATGGRFVQSAFIAKGKNGSQQVFKRRGTDRLPIEKQRAEIEDKANIYIEDEVLGSSEFDDQFMKIFERELRWRTQTL